MNKNMNEVAQSHGFQLTESTYLSEIDGTAHVMRHSASGARLLFLQNDDPEKSFSITFKTPAADDTGVFHILEHSVLCGSRRFPVKEPFVNLLKSSMQTFLNAMTFPDKTMYPVASTNDRDLMNLMQVYLDAVFFPDIYRKETIFQQEGWHLEFAGHSDADGSASEDDAVPADGASGQRRLVYNGVVFNEMKGALSDPDSVLYDTLSAALFPDTTYRFESGGTPEAIPTLTYEAFLDAHRRHYRPDNSYIILYGNIDADMFLGYIDKEYLTPLAEDPSYSHAPGVELPAEGRKASMEPNPLDIQSPVVQMGVRQNMATTPDNSCAALGFVIGHASDREKIVAADILMDAIMGSNVSPMKKALLEAGVANDCAASVIDSIAQPFVMVQAKGLKDDAVAKLVDTVQVTAGRLSQGGLDRSLIGAALSRTEFIMREHSFGYSDGVVLSMSAMCGWLYDEGMPYGYITYEDVLKSLRKKVDEGYFEELIREIFLDNAHHAQVEVVPVDGNPSDALEKRLEALAASMDDAQFDKVASDLELLRQAQSEEDDPAALAKLPRLAISDIGNPPAEPAFGMRKAGGHDVLYHDVATHGIAYTYRYFDMGCLDFDEVPYATVLSMVLGKLPTEAHTAEELDTLIQDKLGNLGFLKEIYDTGTQEGGYRPKFIISASALKENVGFAASLADEVMFRTDFSDHARIKEILIQRRVAIEQKFATSGNSIAVSRANSYYSEVGVLREKMGGVDFYLFLKELIDGFDGRATEISDTLKRVADTLFTQCQTVSFAGGQEALEQYLDALDSDAPTGYQDHPSRLEVPAPCNLHEAFVAPCDVTFTALSADRRAIDEPMEGNWLVASRMLTYSYLWNEVRVKGGAYGVAFSSSRQGPSQFSSFRDPHIDQTIQRFMDSADWLAGFAPTEDEFAGFIVSTAASFDAPLKPRALVRRQDSMHFSDYSASERLEYRSQVVHTKPDDIRTLGRSLKELCDIAVSCTVGNAQIIKDSNQGFNTRDILGA